MPKRPGTTPGFQRRIGDPFFESRKGEPSKSVKKGKHDRVPNFETVDLPEYGENFQSERMRKQFETDLRKVLERIGDVSSIDPTVLVIRINECAKSFGVNIDCRSIGQQILFTYNYGNPPSGSYRVTKDYLINLMKKQN